MLQYNFSSPLFLFFHFFLSLLHSLSLSLSLSLFLSFCCSLYGLYDRRWPILQSRSGAHLAHPFQGEGPALLSPAYLWVEGWRGRRERKKEGKKEEKKRRRALESLDSFFSSSSFMFVSHFPISCPLSFTHTLSLAFLPLLFLFSLPGELIQCVGPLVEPYAGKLVSDLLIIIKVGRD